MLGVRILRCRSAELKSRKAESDRDIASFKHEKLQEMIEAEQGRRMVRSPAFLLIESTPLVFALLGFLSAGKACNL